MSLTSTPKTSSAYPRPRRRRERDGSISVWVINDLLKGLGLRLGFRLVEFSGRVLWEDRVEIDVGANSSTMVRRFSPGEVERYRGGKSSDSVAFIAELAGVGRDEGSTLSRSRIF
ncbi:MAG TPA: hypothetical protein GXX51_02620 [Firmicutes bacterium]|nr:hypothetical protein [Bacillota bacterium]